MDLESKERSAADDILAQLGGRKRLSVTIGAKDFYSEDDGDALVFKITATAKSGIGSIKILLNPMDTYDVTFSRIAKKKDKVLNIFIPEYKVVSVHEEVLVDRLNALIEEETGLLLAPLG